MARHNLAAIIGIFTVAAITLAIIGVIMFSSGQLFSKQDRYVAVFSGSVQGLVKGSPVSFQGVKIGEVVDVQIRFSSKAGEIFVPVIMDVNAELLDNFFQGIKKADLDRASRGVRAKLVPQSLVTGRLMVQIDYEPSQQGELLPSSLKYPQIPTVPSELDIAREAFSSTLTRVAKMPLDEIASNLNNLLIQVNKIVDAPGFNNGISELEQSSKQLNQLLSSLNKDLPQLTQQLTVTLKEFQRSASDISALTKNANNLVDTSQQTIANSNQTLEKIDLTLAQAEATLATYQRLADDNSNLKFNAEQSLNQLNATLKSARSLLDTLQRKPESVIFGK